MRMPGSASPHFFSYYSSSIKCTIAYDRSSMANGCDVTESDVTGIDATGIRRPKVGDSPVYFDLFEVCCTPRVLRRRIYRVRTSLHFLPYSSMRRT
jgi:hypothetical protein